MAAIECRKHGVQTGTQVCLHLRDQMMQDRAMSRPIQLRAEFQGEPGWQVQLCAECATQSGFTESQTLRESNAFDQLFDVEQIPVCSECFYEASKKSRGSEVLQIKDHSRNSILRTLLFAINFCLSVFGAISCVVAIAAPQSPFSCLGGAMGFFPFGIYAWLEWQAIYRKNHATEKFLGYANFGAACFVLFAVISTCYEAVYSGEPLDSEFLTRFSAIGFSIFTYLLFSAGCRLFWARKRIADAS